MLGMEIIPLWPIIESCSNLGVILSIEEIDQRINYKRLINCLLKTGG